MSDVVVARDAAERRLRDHPRPEPPAIRAQVERIVASNQFAAAERLCRFLRFVVEEELAGRGRDIKEYRIGLDVFERPETYDPRLDATVRVEATKLRARLTKYYESEGRNDPVLITVPKGGYVPIIQPRITPHSANQDKPLRWPHWLWVAAAVIVALAVATIATGRLPAWFRSGILTGVPVLARLTWDPGLTSDPAITGDGHYLAYLSNREGSAHLNVWLQSTQGGAPVRLTNHPCNDFSPSFSS
ncbi:MAG: PD40 domain-containing protein, partial [Acidobacteria bacterium]|nr:PD40 domain-containing protein [Acidobacteriota bacterium]